ncbi:TolC family protein [Pelagicoccus enzymogenes]|uniref:TolC family protein n=1 Tax=Pelagicoccus enzymogenes TaxID=2773457 RepID=UPI0028103E26|nr:TolC family protein [Pelagicoccus enzymogenes]MDQ8198486.1 TolC family protein [Pelagicoccus enzymogenes]
MKDRKRNYLSRSRVCPASKLRLSLLSLIACVSFAGASASQAQTLSEALDATLARYPKIRVLESRVLIEQNKLDGERAARRPQLSLSMRGGEERFGNDKGFQVYGETGNASLQGKQLLFDGGNTRHRISEAQANLRTSEESLRKVREDLALELTLTYVNVIKYTRLVNLAEQSVYLHEDALEKIREKFEAGAGPKADVILVNARLAMAKASLEARNRQLKIANNTFLKLTGTYPDRLQEPAFPEWALPESIDEVSFRANPSVRTAHSELQATYSRRKVAESAFRPKLNFVVEGDAAESDRYEKLQEDAMALVTLSYNIFDGGRRRAEINRANSQISEADFKLQDSLIEAETAFANAWNELTSINERIYLLETHRDAMESVVSAYHEQFELGKRPLINLLDVENELSSARASVEEERLNRLQAAYRLLSAMGELTASIK